MFCFLTFSSWWLDENNTYFHLFIRLAIVFLFSVNCALLYLTQNASKWPAIMLSEVDVKVAFVHCKISYDCTVHSSTLRLCFTVQCSLKNNCILIWKAVCELDGLDKSKSDIGYTDRGGGLWRFGCGATLNLKQMQLSSLIINFSTRVVGEAAQ